MPSRTPSSRPWFWSAVVLVLSAGPVAAQPPSPLELVRGLRENGQTDLALEYLKEIENKPLSPEDKAAIGLERAKCLLDASEDEPDEGSRLGMVAVAKEGLNTFLTTSPNHPRRVEGLLAQAKLTSLDAREQLNRARRMDIPPGGESKEEEAARDAAQLKQKEEAKKARPLFLLASKRYAEASDLLRTRLEDKGIDPVTRRGLDREAFEAELAAGINQFNTAETYMPASRVTGAEKEERNKFLEAAKDTFSKLGTGPANNRTVWLARAWVAEVTYEQDDFNTAAQMVAAILKSNVFEAEEGKRQARFFQLRRNFLAALGERLLPKVQASEQELRAWLRTYGNPRKPTPEVFAVRYYLARVLQSLAEATIVPNKKDPAAPIVLSGTARAQLAEAEKWYRGLAQTDHDFTARASRNRMQVVRRLLGDADQPLSSYDTFEKAQMASLIQLSKLATEEGKKDPDAKKIQSVRLAAIALLERSRELASPTDNPADVTDVLLRLIYFYQLADQPYQAAVMGDHVARTIKSTGGKAAIAGLLGLNGYVIASSRLKGDDPDARAADRSRAIALARFLDEKFPNDNATDAARYRLASLLTEDKRFPEAFEAIIKVRPGYAQITNVRLLEGYLASQIVFQKDSPLTPEKKIEVFKRALTDLAKATKPVPVALEADVRAYISAKCRLASLMFAQPRVDAAAEKANPGYNQALAIADEVLAAIPTFDSMVVTEGGAKKLSLDGLEMTMLALDVRARALYLRARALIDADNLDEAAKAIEPALADIEKNGSAVTAEMKGWGSDGADMDAQQKAHILKLAGAVDKTRVEVVLAGFRLRVRQGRAAEGATMLDLVVKVGGTIEENLPVLETLGRETAAKMIGLKKEGKTKEATELGAGLGVLLKKIQAVPKLTSQQLLFIGQMLGAVGEYDAALKALRDVPEPELKEWKTTPQDKWKDLPWDKLPMGLQQRLPSQVTNYAIAQLAIAKALRESKRFTEAEKMLQEIIGTPDKQGWGSGRLYFRKELAAVYEDWGATIADVRTANAQWGKGLQVWTTLFNIHKARLTKLPPPAKPLPPTATDEEKVAWNDKEKRRKDEEKQMKNAYADAYFDVQRCLVKANQQLLKAQPPEKLQKTMEDVAKRCVDMEKQLPLADWDAEVQNQYVDLLKETPALLASYKAQGGKVFLEKKPLDP